MGRFQLDANLDSPFRRADEILAGEGAQADLLFVDFHAEATSEKGAHGLVPGRTGAGGVGHPHPCPHRPTRRSCPRAQVYHRPGDDRPARSILGVKPENSVARFLGQLPRRYEAADGPTGWGPFSSP